MLIIAGSVRVRAAERDEYVADSVPIVEAARAADGCLDFTIAADPVDDDRIIIYERWETEAQLLEFRGSGPTDDQQVSILHADVKRYTIAAVGPP
jgi:quinol monooxygenase YgiN